MEKLLLTNQTGEALYEQCAKHLPIIDFHCHLRPDEIYEDRMFEDLGEMWLKHDHYKWRCMRAFGVPERLITGDASFQEKFMAFAGILPMLIGNPVYAWCQLELARYFDVHEPLGAHNAQAVYDHTCALIRNMRMSPRYFIAQSNVEYIATTDDPIDDLHYHALLAQDASMKTRVVPAFRPDRALGIDKPEFAAYVRLLSEASGVAVADFSSLMAALEARLLFFKAHGAGVTDNGLDNFTFRDSTPSECDAIVRKALSGAALCTEELDRFRSAFLLHSARLYCRHGMLMQLHVSAYRNVNARMHGALGADSGFDVIDEPQSVRAMGALLDAIDRSGEMPRILLYPLNRSQFEPLCVLAASFGGSTRAQVSLGAPWWFNDQPYGIRSQFEATGQLYPLALSMGMVTDSRSFLSYPRHELYRRVLCDYLGALVERGEYLPDGETLARIVQDVCYGNAKAYLGL